MNRIDWRLVKFWGMVVRTLCNFTGKSNFFFARLTLAAGHLACGINAALPYPIYPADILLSFLVMGAVWLAWGKACWEDFALLEKSPQNGVKIVGTYRLCISRLSLHFAGLLPLCVWQEFYVIGIGFILIGASGYFATENWPMKKSCVRRTLQSLGKALQMVGSWLPTPRPHPSPDPA